MGLIDKVFGMLFGSGTNVLQQTAEVFIENKEKGAAREAVMRSDALAQFAGEFVQDRRGLFDRALDAVNRLPRPAMAIGTLGLFASAMIDPIWFSERMQGIALVPEPLWWLLGAIVSFYFGARHQVKNQQFQHQIAASLAMAPQVMQNLDALAGMRRDRSSDDADRSAPAAPRTEPKIRTEAANGARSDVLATPAVQGAHAPKLADVDVSGNAALDEWQRQSRAA